MIHTSGIRNGDHLGLLITDGSTQKERMMSQTINCTFQYFLKSKVGRIKHSQN